MPLLRDIWSNRMFEIFGLCILPFDILFKTNIQHFVSEMLGNMVFGDRAYPKRQYGKISRFNEIISRFSAQFCNWGGGHIQFYHVKKK